MSVPDAVALAWDELTRNWDDQARHDALLGLVAHYSCYAWAAGKYKDRGDDPIAARQLVRLRKAATATLLASATVRPERTSMPFKGSILVLAFVGIMTAVGLAYLALRPTPVAHIGAP